MSDEADDYLSDKFLVSATAATPKTYTELRKEAGKKSKLKNEQNRQKSRRQLELESREEGLSKSLFTRAKEEQDSGLVEGNKALSIMMKMGFKPGQSLGKVEPSQPVETPTPHKAEPLPLHEWEGKTGIGVRKRPHSPSSAERVAKMAKMADNATQMDFRDRKKRLYEIASAQGKLVSAQRTCVTLDEKAGKTFNVLWLNPQDPQTFPPGLLDALSLHANPDLSMLQTRPDENEEERLRRQIRSEMLSDSDEHAVVDHEAYADIIEEATHFLRLQAPDQLHFVLSYLRDTYYYCFWCGTQYDSEEEMDQHCPGQDEDSHD